jgi:hypothetical protein
MRPCSAESAKVPFLMGEGWTVKTGEVNKVEKA